MIDKDDVVLPVAPVMGNKAIRIMPFGMEQKTYQSIANKKTKKTPSKDKDVLKCTVTAEKVDCQI